MFIIKLRIGIEIKFFEIEFFVKIYCGILKGYWWLYGFFREVMWGKIYFEKWVR